MTDWLVRPLTAADLPAYRTARLAALKDHPEAYGSSWEEEREYDDDVLLARILPPSPNVMLGAFDGETLVGMGSLVVQSRLKLRHIGVIYGIYVGPAFRGAGIGRAVVGALLDAARAAGVLIVHLSVTTGNDNARRLYTGLGFKPIGLSRRALRVGERFLDEEYMSLDFD